MKVHRVLALSIAFSAASAWSQNPPAPSDVPSALNSRFEIFGGFALQGGRAPNNAGRNETGTARGFNGGVDLRLVPHLFAVANVIQSFPSSASGSDTTSDTIFLFGPRYVARARSNPRFSVFGEFLAGCNTYHNSGQAYTWAFNSATNYAFTAGGGFDYAWSRHLGIRFDGGYLRTRFTLSTYGGPANPPYITNNLGQFSVDMVYRF